MKLHSRRVWNIKKLTWYFEVIWIQNILWDHHFDCTMGRKADTNTPIWKNVSYENF